MSTDVPLGNYIALTANSTGTGAQVDKVRFLDCAIGDCVVKVALSPNNEFLGVVEVAAKKDFQSSGQRQGSGFHDVNAFYKD
jgi:hypothetical protein